MPHRDFRGWRFPWSGAGLFAGAAAWAAHQQLGFLLTQWSCEGGGRAVFYAVSAVAMLVTLGGLFLSWRDLRTANAGPREVLEIRRTRLVAAMGCGAAAIFLLAIIAQTLAATILTGCER